MISLLALVLVVMFGAGVVVVVAVRFSASVAVAGVDRFRAVVDVSVVVVDVLIIAGSVAESGVLVVSVVDAVAVDVVVAAAVIDVVATVAVTRYEVDSLLVVVSGWMPLVAAEVVVVVLSAVVAANVVLAALVVETCVHVGAAPSKWPSPLHVKFAGAPSHPGAHWMVQTSWVVTPLQSSTSYWAPRGIPEMHAFGVQSGRPPCRDTAPSLPSSTHLSCVGKPR
mmetsp:Transcript_34995/g.98225  ORF Transcript_34995/g.98225 Transcript_34995/m.98225 type:complete len:224 (-) Transcript_34995:934-1605(-)